MPFATPSLSMRYDGAGMMVLLVWGKGLSCLSEAGEALSSKTHEFRLHQLSQWLYINVYNGHWTCDWGSGLPFGLSFDYLSNQGFRQVISQCQ